MSKVEKHEQLAILLEVRDSVNESLKAIEAIERLGEGEAPFDSEDWGAGFAVGSLFADATSLVKRVLSYYRTSSDDIDLDRNKILDEGAIHEILDTSPEERFEQIHNHFKKLLDIIDKTAQAYMGEKDEDPTTLTDDEINEFLEGPSGD